METIMRNGYGSSFNKLTIYNNNLLKKESISEYGNEKISYEIMFYKYIKNNNIQFPSPNIFEYGLNYYVMEYLQNFTPLYKIFPSFTRKKQQIILSKIFEYLLSLHKITTIIDKQSFFKALEYEFKDKLYSRYQSIKILIDKYTFIKQVNSLHVKSFDICLETHFNKILRYYYNLDEYSFSLIHGDCQFNNILIDLSSDDIIFIDPRGSFGGKPLFGLKEYDLAKIKFALSGYDEFDNSTIESLNIENDNIILKSMQILPDCLCKNDIITSITVLIWLGNAHCFINQPLKAVTSFFYALYLATLYE